MINKPFEPSFSQVISDVKGFAIFMTDVNGLISTWSTGCKLMKEYTAEEVIGQHYKMLFPDFLREEGLPEKGIAIARETGRYETENWRRKKSGELFWACVSLTRVLDEEGNLLGFIKITQDCSEEKRIYDQFQSKIEDFRRLDEEISSFIMTAAHDLKAPINNIEGLAFALKEEVDKKIYGDEGLSHIIDMIHKSTLRFRKLITEMALSAKEESEDYGYHSFGDVVDEIRDLLALTIENTNTVFREDYHEAPFIRFPRKHIQSILQNLITNAIKYRSPLRNPVIKIKTTKSDGFTLLEVSDNGLGIKRDDQEKILLMYQRLEETSTEEGTGVGLALVAKIVKDNKGKIEVESTLKEGTTFKIFLK